MNRAVIFDLDGTLADTLEDIAGAVNRALGAHGLAVHSLDDYCKMIGDGFLTLVQRALPADLCTVDLVAEVRAKAADDYASHCLDRTSSYPGVPGLLEALAGRGVPMAVLSNKPHELTLLVVRGLFPNTPFTIIRGELDAFPRKPDPTSALDIAKRLGMAPRDVLYLGDSNVDMETARGAGMVALGAGWGFRGEAELLASGAKAVLATPGELLDYL